MCECQAQNHYGHKTTRKGVDLSIATNVEVGHFLAKVILFPNTVRRMPPTLSLGVFAAVTAVSNMRHIIARLNFLRNFILS